MTKAKTYVDGIELIRVDMTNSVSTAVMRTIDPRIRFARLACET